MIGYDLIFYVPISFIFFYFGYRNAKKDNLSKWYMLTFICAITYINCAIDKLFFPIFYDVPEAVDIKSRMNFEIDFSNMMGIQIFYNTLVTVPLAISLLFIFRTQIKKVVVFSVLSSGMIEIVQLIILVTIKPGNVYFDVLDMILNLSGGILGCVLLLIARKIAQYIKIKGFVGYIAETLKIS